MTSADSPFEPAAGDDAVKSAGREGSKTPPVSAIGAEEKLRPPERLQFTTKALFAAWTVGGPSP